MALTHSPTLLIADEATFGLDVTIQAQVLETFRTLIAESSAAALLVTRDLGIVAHYCDRAAVMYGGEIVEEASVAELFANPSHPYTQRLLAAVRYDRAEPTPVELFTGSFNPLQPPAHCFFYDRCPRRMDVCQRDHPQPLEIDPEHWVRCRLYEKWTGDG
jgi:oligopeptide/dipeptide ABC transporter ATP-binding protein